MNSEMSQETSHDHDVQSRGRESDSDLILNGKRRADKSESPRQEVLLENPKLGVTGTLLHMLSSCKLRTLRKLNKAPHETAPTPFAKEKTEDGRNFEKELVASKKVWQKLFQSQFGTPIDLEHFDEEWLRPKTNRDKKSEVQKQLIAAHLEETNYAPVLFSQITIRHIDPITGELFDGDADFILWTGSEWHLGEIKSTPQPRAATALQLGHYQNIWSTWAPRGENTSTQVFILHPQPGWEYQTKASPTHRQKCLEATQLTTFNLEASRSAHTESLEELRELQALGPCPPDDIAKSPLIHDCAECLYRISCFKRFAEDAIHPDGPHIATAGFDEAEQDWLKDEFGITRTRHALARLDELELLHEGNPVLRKEIEDKLIQAERFYGVFSWAVPTRVGNFVFYATPKKANHPCWVVNEEAVEFPTPTIHPKEAYSLITFTRYEARSAYTKLMQGGMIAPQNIICLEDELQEETLIAFEDLSLYGISQTLQGILREGSWRQYAPIMIHQMETHPDREERIRVVEVADLWKTMLKLHQESNPTSTQIA